jgi:hypothetical protein
MTWYNTTRRETKLFFVFKWHVFKYDPNHDKSWWFGGISYFDTHAAGILEKLSKSP